MDMRKTEMLLLGLGVGVLVGAGVGLLCAPMSGKAMRQKLKDMEEDFVDKAEEIFEDGKKKLMDQKSRIEETVGAGVKAFTRER